MTSTELSADTKNRAVPALDTDEIKNITVIFSLQSPLNAYEVS
jgi:hypothetical protein